LWPGNQPAASRRFSLDSWQGLIFWLLLMIVLALPAIFFTSYYGAGLLGFSPAFASIAFQRRMRLMMHLSQEVLPGAILAAAHGLAGFDGRPVGCWRGADILARCSARFVTLSPSFR